MDTFQDLTFEQWTAKCERLALSRAGVDLDALGDGNSWDAWSDGVEPMEYVTDRMLDAGFPFE